MFFKQFRWFLLYVFVANTPIFTKYRKINQIVIICV
jgi:hypothetical protein